MDKIYRKIPLEKISWNIQKPPDVLVELVRSKKVKPCKTIDLGCGIGNYAIYLGGLGFDVTGIDVSPTAIDIDIEKAKKKLRKHQLYSLFFISKWTINNWLKCEN